MGSVWLYSDCQHLRWQHVKLRWLDGHSSWRKLLPLFGFTVTLIPTYMFSYTHPSFALPLFCLPLSHSPWSHVALGVLVWPFLPPVTRIAPSPTAYTYGTSHMPDTKTNGSCPRHNSECVFAFFPVTNFLVSTAAERLIGLLTMTKRMLVCCGWLKTHCINVQKNAVSDSLAAIWHIFDII